MDPGYIQNRLDHRAETRVIDEPTFSVREHKFDSEHSQRKTRSTTPCHPSVSHHLLSKLRHTYSRRPTFTQNGNHAYATYTTHKPGTQSDAILISVRIESTVLQACDALVRDNLHKLLLCVTPFLVNAVVLGPTFLPPNSIHLIMVDHTKCSKERGIWRVRCAFVSVR